MNIAGIEIELIKKEIKNIHLAVYPPDGRVRLAAPKDVNEKSLELYVTSKLTWIKKQQRMFSKVDRQSEREYVSRESHYFLGKKYVLRVHSSGHTYPYPKVILKSRTHIDMYVKETTSKDQKASLLSKWSRTQLNGIISLLLPKWEKTLNVKANKYRIQSMKTKWGSCKTETKNLMFNVELSKKSKECIEYVVVHELLHLKERKHNDRFMSLLDKHLPKWKFIREELNS